MISHWIYSVVLIVSLILVCVFVIGFVDWLFFKVFMEKRKHVE
jgi:hypothetical protein